MSEFEAFGSEGVDTNNYLEPCSICGRRFNSQALSRHYPICQKSSQKTRKTFDASKQRAEGTEINTVTKTKTRGSHQISRNKEPQPKKSNWRQKHEDFINSIRSARGVSEALKTGGPLPPPPPPSINPDYIQCPYCSRRFSESAADRHINFCKEQSQRLPKGKTPPSRMANTRKQYQPPKLKSKQNSTQQYGSSRTPPQSGTRNGSYNSDAYSPGYGDDRGRPGGITGTPLGRNPKSRYQAGDYIDSSPPSSGKPLRTGRNTETLSSARELSANQRTTSLKQRTPSNEALNRYPGSSPTSSAGHSSRPTSLYSGSSSPSGRPPAGHAYNGKDSGYHDSDSDNRRKGSGIAKFCHECGTKYPVSRAKFCCECGIKRVFVH